MTTRPRSLTCLLYAGLLFLVPQLAVAGPNAGGTLILHANPSLVYTNETQSYCGMAALDSCSAAVTSVAWDPDHTVVFHVIAAFPPESQPRMKGVSFGVDYDPEKFALTAHGTCADMEIPDGGWPQPGTGTGQTWTYTTQTALLTEVYWFAGHAYSEVNPDSTSFSLIPRPLDGGIFVDDAAPRMADSVAAYGRLGFGGRGLLPCPAGAGEVIWEQGAGPQSDGSGADGAPIAPESDGDGCRPSESASLTLVELVPATDSTFAQNIHGLEADYGLRVLVAIIPDIAICLASPDQLQSLVSDERVTAAAKSAILNVPTIATNTIEPGQPGLGPTIWNYLLNPAQPETTSYSFPYACGVAPDSEKGFDNLPQQDKNRQTSVFMMGQVGISLVFVESQDSRPCFAPDYTENWTLTERTQVFAEVVQGLTSRSLQDPGLVELDSRAQLQFDILEIAITPTSVEPIRGTHGSETWGKEALAYLGFGDGDLTTRAYALDNERRRSWATDWWYTALVVRDICDQDGEFSDGYSAFAQLYGPHLTVTTRNGGYGINNLDYVFAHETCHIFGAGDEYAESDCAQHCADRYGYLHIATDNCTGCTSQQVPCIMNSMVRPFQLCPTSKGQLGWRDGEVEPDGVFDPIEQPTASRSMRLQATTVYAGDYVDIWTEAGDWVKRVALSSWDADRGGALWDGFNYAGWECAPGVYSWQKNGGGSLRSDGLLPEQYAPELSDVSVQDGTPPKLRFGFVDDDTYSGRVRATIKRLGRPDKYAIGDKFYVDTFGSVPPIEVPLDFSDGQGLYTIEVRVWDSGGGREDVETVQYAYGGTAGVGEPPGNLGIAGPGIPNPSTGSVRWSIPVGADPVTSLGIFAVDGRMIRQFATDHPKAGTWTVTWDGRDESGRSVPRGRYYLRAETASATRGVGVVTISK